MHFVIWDFCDTKVRCLEASVLETTVVVGLLGRQGLGAKAGLVLFGVPGEEWRLPACLQTEPDISPGLCSWISFGLGANGGFCVPECMVVSSSHVFLLNLPLSINVWCQLK